MRLHLREHIDMAKKIKSIEEALKKVKSGHTNQEIIDAAQTKKQLLVAREFLSNNLENWHYLHEESYEEWVQKNYRPALKQNSDSQSLVEGTNIPWKKIIQHHKVWDLAHFIGIIKTGINNVYPPYLGNGFFISQDLFLTTASSLNNYGLFFHDNIDNQIGKLDERSPYITPQILLPQLDMTFEFETAPYLARANAYDLAKVQIDYDPSYPLPKNILQLQQTPLTSEELNNRLVCLVGCGISKNGKEECYLMPGRLHKNPFEYSSSFCFLRYDSTSVVNPGGFLVDLGTIDNYKKGIICNNVIGIHVGSKKGTDNFAIPTWEINNIIQEG